MEYQRGLQRPARKRKQQPGPMAGEDAIVPGHGAHAAIA